jgi:hypothetical protein
MQVAWQGHWSHSLQLPGGSRHLPAARPGQLLSLAQRQGLVKRPAKLLTSAQWTNIREKSCQRAHANYDCAICQEPFRDGKQASSQALN